MDKPRYFPWNEEEFRADSRVRTMSYIQQWMYRTLLQAAFFESTRPYLPDDDGLLWAMAGCKSKSQWTENMISVRGMFIPIELNGKKLLSHKRLVKDWQKIEDDREARADRARKAGLASAQHRFNTSQLQVDIGSTLVNNKSTDANERELSKRESKREGKEDISEPTVGSHPFIFTPEEQKVMEALYKQFVAIWKENHGESATCPYPNFDDEKKAWKVLHSNHDHALLLQAFELWTKEQAEQGITERFPLGKFVRIADKYMQKIVPLKTAGVKEKREKAEEAIANANAKDYAERAFKAKPKVSVATEDLI